MASAIARKLPRPLGLAQSPDELASATLKLIADNPR
jgi:hypothetical protein